MSEYWKSTPKYWCKHCKTYVRDTKLERQNHESTGKHQGAIKRFLRDLHRGHEREDREKQRAKDEVARLNGLTPVGGPAAGARPGGEGGGGGAPWRRTTTATNTVSNNAGINPAERAKQIKQLAEMGVVVPDEFRKEMAMTGEWEIVSQKAIGAEDPEVVKHESGDSKQDIKSEAPLNVGVKRRRVEGQDEMEEAGERVAKKGWGGTTRGWSDLNEELDLESLMGKGDTERPVKTEEDAATEQTTTSTLNPPQPLSDTTSNSESTPRLKKEDSQSALPTLGDMPTHNAASPIKHETKETLDSGIIFKKRKPKPVRQR